MRESILKAKRDTNLHIRIPAALKAQLLAELAELQRRIPTRVGYSDFIIFKLSEKSAGEPARSKE